MNQSTSETSSSTGHEKTLTMATGVSDLIAALAHRERQIEAIRRTSDALFSHPNVDAMIQATLRVAMDVLRADAGTVFLHDPADDTLVLERATRKERRDKKRDSSEIWRQRRL